MTIVRISDPSLLELLLAELTSRPDVVAEIVEGDAIRVSILGSYSESSMRMAILLRIRAWEAAQRARGVDVEVDLDY
jgi:protein involved in polysaccharide export with SLBB domain